MVNLAGLTKRRSGAVHAKKRQSVIMRSGVVHGVLDQSGTRMGPGRSVLPKTDAVGSKKKDTRPFDRMCWQSKQRSWSGDRRRYSSHRPVVRLGAEGVFNAFCGYADHILTDHLACISAVFNLLLTWLPYLSGRVKTPSIYTPYRPRFTSTRATCY
jgi:hypothetical protein